QQPSDHQGQRRRHVEAAGHPGQQYLHDEDGKQ
ncbi:MAG: hypothetical protein QOE91_1170, partial [Gaiellaceae bacterium]|nr:hypothetical protein [Gaiellaceae bacterium]